MGTSRTVQSDWMATNGNGNTTADNVFAGPGGWYILHENGQSELLHAMTGADEAIANAPDIQLLRSPVDGEYDIADSDVMSFVVNWSEPVTVDDGGVPYLSVTINAVAVNFPMVGGEVVGATSSTFELDVSSQVNVGAVVVLDPAIVLNSATIVASDPDGTAAVLALPADFSQPTGVTVVDNT